MAINDEWYGPDADEDDTDPDYVVHCDDTEPRRSGSVWVFFGTTESGDSVTFAVDHRPAQGLLCLIEDHGSIPVVVESWQILTRERTT